MFEPAGAELRKNKLLCVHVEGSDAPD